MKAVILAAGKGERLEPITHTRPKPLIPVLDKPLLLYIVESLVKAGVNELVIVVGYMADKVREEINKAKITLKKTFVYQEEQKGTGHALKLVEKHVGSEPFILIYGDLFINENVINKVLNTSDYGKYNTMALTKVANPKEYGVVVTEGDRVKDVIEKPSSPPTNTINAGIYVLKPEVFSYLDKIGLSSRGEYELTDALKLMLKDNVEIRYTILSADEWFEIGKPWDLLSLHERLLSRLSGGIIQGDVEDYVKIKGPVIIRKGAVIRSGTYIIGPVFIGEDAVVGPNSFIRPYSVIGRGSRIGNAVEVKNSTLMEYVHAQHLSYIGDSIVCEHVNLGAGTITANLRFDNGEVKVYVKGKRISSGRRKLGAIIGGYVKTGINVSLMPGVKIGAYSWIAPGAVVYRDVPPKTFLNVKIEYMLKEL